ncbi:MAG: hypothetical protein EOP11_17545 [Proteobacteria bacterium]|nr:MAG: hypothetical protein EOP11_17545 [Pseudomonadota bacterium]
MKKTIVTALSAFIATIALAAPAQAFEHKETYEKLAVPEYEVKITGGSFLVFGLEYFEKANDEVICAKSKAPLGLPAIHSCYTPTISGDKAMERYNNLSIESALEYSENGNRVIALNIMQKADGLGFCRKVTPVAPAAEDAPAYACFEPAR